MNIKMWTDTQTLLTIPECRPRSAAKAIPEWFKNTPAVAGMPTASLFENMNRPRTAKMCPALPDFMNQGVVIPAWSDMIISTDTHGNWSWQLPEYSPFRIDTHSKEQFLAHVPEWASTAFTMAFKLVCPWYLKTEPGWSVYQMPLFYHFQKDFTIAPGVIETDTHHVLNQQLLVHTSTPELFIERGTPLAWYIPFKREEHTFEILEKEEDIESAAKETSKKSMAILTKFRGAYRSMTEGQCPMREIKHD